MSTLQAVQERMERSLEALRREFAGVRTGKATPALLDSIRVEAYGSMVPLNQVASVSAPEARLLVIQPWDAGMINPVERAIQMSDLGLNPSNDGKIVRVPIPPLTEERRREFVKHLHKLAEDARIGLRQARKDANDQIRGRQKDGELSEDEARREQDEVQKVTDRYVEKIEEMLKVKESEIMEV